MAESDDKRLVNDEEKQENEIDLVSSYGATVESGVKSKKTLCENSIVVRIEDISKDRKIVDRFRLPDDVCTEEMHVDEIDDDDACHCPHSLSKDSDSLIQDINYSSTSQHDSSRCWWFHPKVTENWRTVLSAVALFLIGTALLITGIVVEIIPHPGLQGFVFLIAGSICFIPGAYHIFYIYCAVKGKRGYDFYHLPLFN